MLYIYLIILTFISNVSYAQSVYQKLDKRMVTSNSLVCVGLDPDIHKMPLSIQKLSLTDEEKVYTFLTQVIEITVSHACSFKLQKAFYDQFEHGHELLRNISNYIHTHYPNVPVFVDCKIGDTDNTMDTYMKLLFDDIKADSIVVNPYMGDDVLRPFMNDSEKSAIVLIQTSNPDAKIIQEIVTMNGKKVWEEILDLTLNKWNTCNNLILVLSSNTDSCNYELIRQQIPQNVPILLAGIGAQGGDPLVMKQLLNNYGRGVFVNSSRGILYPYTVDDVKWKEAVLKAVVGLKDMLNTIRER